MKFFEKLFKRRYPYAPIAFLGLKNTEKMLGADITKLKKVEKEQAQNNQKHEQAETKQTEKHE